MWRIVNRSIPLAWSTGACTFVVCNSHLEVSAGCEFVQVMPSDIGVYVEFVGDLRGGETFWMFTREEAVDYYTSKMGISLRPEQWLFYEVFGLFRLAVIAQQIYYRYFHKQTHNKAYKEFHYVVLYLDYRCRKLIREAGKR